MRMSRVYCWLLVVMLSSLGLVGCASGSEPRVETAVMLPTRVPTVTPEYNNLDAAERTARTFLRHWRAEEYESMYALLTESSQQATTFERFQSIYQNTDERIRLDGLDYTMHAIAREGNRVVTLVYDVTFESDLLGSFQDTNREIQLVIDDETQTWHVAWSRGSIFREMGNGAALRLETFQPSRGSIYDRDGDILADMNGRVVKIRVVPDEVPVRDTCIRTLSEALDEDVETVQERLDEAPDDWLTDMGIIEGEVYRNYADALRRDCNAEFPGRATRRYIHGELFAHIIGTVGYPEQEEIDTLEAAGFQQDSIIGRSGIEQSWDETLRGTPGGRLSLVSPGGETLRILKEKGTNPAQSVYLTIDNELQRAVLNRMKQAYAENAQGWAQTSDGGATVILDVQTGAVLALVSYPTYDANAFTPFPVMGEDTAQQIVQQVQDDPRRPQLNRATQGAYPSGSTMKTFSAIAALDSGEYTMDERYNSTGTWSRDIVRRDWLRGGHGLLTLSQALTHSCNSCFYEVGYRLNNADPYLLPEYANKMGFGVDPGLEDLQATDGFIGTPDTKPQLYPQPWSFSDAVDMAIGQGMVDISPLQMAMAYEMVANGGTRYRPQVVSHAGLLDETTYEMTPEVLETLDLSSEIVDYVHEGLCNVTTTRSGTASHIFRGSTLLDTVGVCGKTGTAQNNDESDQPHGWFAAWAPSDNPEIVAVTIIENAGDGSAVAAPIVRDILEYYFLDEERQLTAAN